MATKRKTRKRVSTALKKFLKANPARKRVKVKSFTGTITRNKNGTVTVKGRGKVAGKKRANPKRGGLYAVFESRRGYGLRQVDEREAKSGAAAIRALKASQRARGNLPPSGTKYMARLVS